MLLRMLLPGTRGRALEKSFSQSGAGGEMGAGTESSAPPAKSQLREASLETLWSQSASMTSFYFDRGARLQGRSGPSAPALR